MFINKTNIKFLAAALLTALAAPSCLNLDETQEGGYGYLTISGLDLDVQVEQLVPTKAESVTLASLGVNAAPDVTNAVFTLVKDGESQTVQPNTELKLQAGTYNLNITYDNKGADGFGEALFGDASYPVTITAGQNTPLEYSLPLANSLVAVSVSDELKNDFTPGSISIAYGQSTSATITENEYFFVPAVSSVTVTVNGTTAGVSNPLEHTFTTPSAAKYADVKFGKSTTDIPSITLGDVSGGAFEGGLYFSPAVLDKISSDHTVVYEYRLNGASDWTTAQVSDVNGYKYLSGLTDGETYLIKACVGNIESNHVEFSPVSLENCVTVAAASGYPQHYTENNELAGTKMQASVTVNLPSIVAEMATLSVENGNFNKGSNQLGTFNLTNNTLTNNTAKSIEISNSTDWPYFPKGDDYVLNATVKCVLPNNRTVTSNPVASTATITSPAPSFNVTVSAETSYSRYLNYKDGVSGYSLDLANTAGSGDDIMNISAKVGISNGILNNSNYTELYSVTSFKVDETALTNTSSAVGTLTAANLDGQSWAKHIVSASFKFDGIEKSGSKDCHVTGLPYSINFKTSSEGWTLKDNCSREDDGLHFDPTATPYANRKFNIPADTDVSLYLYSGVQLNATSSISRAQLNVKIGSQNNESVLKAEYVFLGNKTTTTNSETLVTGILGASSNEVELKTNGLVSGMWVVVPGLRIIYR